MFPGLPCRSDLPLIATGLQPWGLHKGSHVEQLPDARKCELLLDARRDPVKRVRARATKALARLAEYD